MGKKTFHLSVSGIFFIIFVLHFARLVFRWEVVVSGVIIPGWVSILAILIALTLVYYSNKFGKRLRN